MALRVLYWNIENFAQNKVADRKRKRAPALNGAVKSAARLNYIMANVAAANPDIFAVVEVETSYANGTRGMLIEGSAMAGLLIILGQLRALNANWQLVPPLRTGPKEGVAVFYRGDKLIFSGPYVWPGGDNQAAVAPGNNAAAYPSPFKNGIKGQRDVPNQALQNVGVAERMCAGRIAFTRRNGIANAGNAYDFGDRRRAPFMVSFCDMTGANGAFVRNVTLFLVHSPASRTGARDFLTTALPSLAQITDGLANNEVRAVIGDFNLNLIKTDDSSYQTDYDVLVNAPGNYTLALIPAVKQPQNPAANYRAYFATHIRRRSTAEFLSRTGVDRLYPGYAYIGGDKHNYDAIDNVYVRYGANVAPPNPTNMTILNGVVGSPLTAFPAPPNNPPPGTLGLATGFQGWNAFQATAQAYNVGLEKRIRGWTNYGRVRSVSDHFALALDI